MRMPNIIDSSVIFWRFSSVVINEALYSGAAFINSTTKITNAIPYVLRELCGFLINEK